MKKGDLVEIRFRSTAELCGFGLFIATHKAGMQTKNGQAYASTSVQVLCESGHIYFPSWRYVVARHDSF